MYLESLILSNFRCFGPDSCRIDFPDTLTTFVGLNGSGKTATMQALQRLFGVTTDQRRIRKQDFHVPANETETPLERKFRLQAVFAFPELKDPTADHSAVPEFFQQSVADENGSLKCIIQLDATLTEDGTTEGTITQRLTVRESLAHADDEEALDLKPADRSRVQLVYVPATRDGASQVTAFLKGRLWRAVNWSDSARTVFAESGGELNEAFEAERPVATVTEAVTSRWQEVHSGGTFTTPLFRPIDLRFEEFINKVEITFKPDHHGRQRGIEELSDGQRSLFHLALTAATLDIEAKIASNQHPEDFQRDSIAFPALTLIAIEEPENNLAPFYLSRIIKQVQSLTNSTRAQAFISSHSAGILTRIDPEQIRHFRLTSKRTAVVHTIRMPQNDEDASKYLREAVRAYPELYFSKAVILGEGASEEVVIPRLAESMSLDIDRSFVAIVPLGGRHVNHLWKLLNELEIPFVTLLDLDWGRSGGGWGRIKQAIVQLLANGVTTTSIFGLQLDETQTITKLAEFNAASIDTTNLMGWVNKLESYQVYFCDPLDLDFSMLTAYSNAYEHLPSGMQGPSNQGNPKDAVLGDSGNHAAYDTRHDSKFRWYRYLFLGRGKPSTHVRVLSSLTNEEIFGAIPEVLKRMLLYVDTILNPPAPPPPPPSPGSFTQATTPADLK